MINFSCLKLLTVDRIQQFCVLPLLALFSRCVIQCDSACYSTDLCWSVDYFESLRGNEQIHIRGRLILTLRHLENSKACCGHPFGGREEEGGEETADTSGL